MKNNIIKKNTIIIVHLKKGFSLKTFEELSIADPYAQAFTNTNPTVFLTLNLTTILTILNAVANDSFEPELIASIALDFRVKK